MSGYPQKSMRTQMRLQLFIFSNANAHFREEQDYDNKLPPEKGFSIFYEVWKYCSKWANRDESAIKLFAC